MFVIFLNSFVETQSHTVQFTHLKYNSTAFSLPRAVHPSPQSVTEPIHPSEPAALPAPTPSALDNVDKKEVLWKVT